MNGCGFQFICVIRPWNTLSFNASEGHHDDLVVARGLAWLGVGITGVASFTAHPVEWRR
jgi:hypothetical protein